MSIVIDKSSLSQETVLNLNHLLHIIPAQDFRKKKKGKFARDTSPTGLDVFSTSLDSISGKTFLHIPFFFGCRYFKTNNDTHHNAKVEMKFTGTIREGQKPFINKAIGHLNTTRCTTLNLPPGTGKTTMCAALSCNIGLLTVVLVHDSNLLKQWKKTYQERTTASVWIVGEKNSPQYVDVILCLWTRVDQIPQQLKDLVGLVVIDEAHEFPNKTGLYSILIFRQVKCVIAATATFERRDGMHLCIEAIVGKEKVTTDKLIPFKVTEYHTDIQATREKKNGMINWHVLNQSLLYNDYRNGVIIEMMLRLVSMGRKILIFTTEVNHVNRLYEMIKALGTVSVDYLSGSKSSYNDCQVLVGNTQKCGTGFDEEMFCDDFSGTRIDTLMLVGSFRDIALTYQVVGRALRSADPWVFDFVDDDDTIKSQYSDRKWFYKRYGAEGRIMIERRPGTSTSTMKNIDSYKNAVYVDGIEALMAINKITIQDKSTRNERTDSPSELCNPFRIIE